MNKKITKVLLLLSLITSPIFQNCNHQHDDSCGYNWDSQTRCMHQHDEYCEDDNSYELLICDPNDVHCK